MQSNNKYLKLLSPYSAAFILATAAILSHHALAVDEPNDTRYYNIPAASLESSLNTFGREAGILLGFDAAAVKGLRSAGIDGEYSVLDGLRQLVSQTGSQVIHHADGSYVIKRSAGKQKQSAALIPVKVTGTLAERSIMETPNSVVVTQQAILQQRNMQSLEDAVTRAPGVLQLGENVGYSIRGVRQNGASNATTIFNKTLSIFVDGVRQTSRSMEYDAFNLFDARQVEIFRGGQSTNRGAASIAGGIEIRTNDPEFFSAAQAQAGTKYSRQHRSLGYHTNLVYNQPISQNWALRVTGGYDYFDGYTINTTRNKDMEKKNNNARVKLLYESADKGFKALTSLYSSELDEGKPWVIYPHTERRTRDADEEEYYKNKTRSISQFLQKTFSNRLRLEVQLSALTGKFKWRNDYNFSARPGSVGLTSEEDDNVTGEFKLIYEGEEQNFIVGLYADHNEQSQSSDITFDGARFRIPGTISRLSKQNAERENYAVYSEYERRLHNSLSLRAGLRVDIESQEIDVETISNAARFKVPKSQLDTDFLEVLPSLALTWHIDSQNNLSLMFKKDYRAGGVVSSIGAGGLQEYDPEYTRTVELAWRGARLGGNVDVQVNAYYTQWKDQQVRVGTTPIFFEVKNAGKSTQSGIETQIEWLVKEHAEFYLSAAYNDSKFDDFDAGALGDFSKDRFPFAPRWSGNAGVTWFLNDLLSLDLNMNYQGNSSDQVGSPRSNDAYNVFNTSLSYQQDNWHVKFWINNITDRDYVTFAGRFDALVGAPRTFGATARLEF